VRRSLALVLALTASLALAACGSGESDGGSGSVAESVEEHLGYLEPESSAVVVVDMRYEEENWQSLLGIADRLLEEARSAAEPGDRGDVPADAQEALGEFTRFWRQDFEEDVKPLLDGRLVIGLALRSPTEPGPSDVPDVREVIVYRTDRGNLREALEKTLDNSPLRPMRGRDDVLVTPEGIALVGDDTLVAGETVEQVAAAIERAEAGGGFPAELLEAAERGTGIDDPLVLATGTLELARVLGAWSENIERAAASVPYLAAVEHIDLAVDVSEEGVEANAQVATTGAELSEDQLPLGPAGDVELPVAEGAIAGGSLDQSRLTTFAATVVRSVFADSDFVVAVEETERELGIRFEDEVLRQFDCPSVSVFVPEAGAPLGAGGHFSARSCVRDPERMRELLPELAPRLPRILRAMRGLGGEGLLGLLMLAPDAPLSPGALLLQIVVEPLGGGAPEEQLYEVSGLREADTGEAVFPGPDRVVFGMIGDDFVVGSDRQAARDAAALETEPAGEQAASALRVPPELLSGPLLGLDEAGVVLGRTFGDLEIGFSADPRATRAHARMPLAD
jgi:hypothetical protein